MDELKTKQQVIDKLKQAEKVLVTVSKNPSVDALSAALGLALLLDGQGKYATAIFSGETPPALAFLEPEKTFDDTTDSLRDFIIALNKEKADHLRYKVVDDAVKIFITPYKTTITEDDLEFSQGDYNVELVVAIGVDNQEDLDAALDNHGQILHDAAIVTVSAGEQTSSLGGIDWSDKNASSLSEMIASIADGLKKDKKDTVLTAPVATALLTGIVAETDRFSNERTSSKSMTIAATLMAAGADQQLIANELQSAHEIDTPLEVAPEAPVEEAKEVSTATSDGGLSIQHDPSERPVKTGFDANEDETLEELDARVRGKTKEEIITEEAMQAAENPVRGPFTEEPQEEVQAEPAVTPEPVSQLTPQPAPSAPTTEAPQIEEVQAAAPSAPQQEPDEAPLMGGTLNAAMSQPVEQPSAEGSQNTTILTHGYLAGSESASEAGQAAINSVGDTDTDAVVSLTDTASAYAIAGEKVIEPLTPDPVAAPAPTPTENAYGIAAPEVTLPMPPPIPDFSQVGAAGPALPLPPTEPPQILGDILNPAPVTNAYASEDAPEAPLSQSATVPLAPVPEAPQVAVQPSGAYASDPGQFQIPAQEQ